MAVCFPVPGEADLDSEWLAWTSFTLKLDGHMRHMGCRAHTCCCLKGYVCACKSNSGTPRQTKAQAVIPSSNTSYLDSYNHVARVANILDVVVRIVQSIYSQRPFTISTL